MAGQSVCVLVTKEVKYKFDTGQCIQFKGVSIEVIIDEQLKITRAWHSGYMAAHCKSMATTKVSIRFYIKSGKNSMKGARSLLSYACLLTG